MARYRFTARRRRALARARGKWKRMSPRARAKRMPGGRGPIRTRRRR